MFLMSRILSINDERVILCHRSPLPRVCIPQTRWHPTLPQRNHGLSHITTITGDGASGALPILSGGTHDVFEPEAISGTSFLAGLQQVYMI